MVTLKPSQTVTFQPHTRTPEAFTRLAFMKVVFIASLHLDVPPDLIPLEHGLDLITSVDVRTIS